MRNANEERFEAGFAGQQWGDMVARGVYLRRRLPKLPSYIVVPRQWLAKRASLRKPRDMRTPPGDVMNGH
jgi:hypothetical protein